MNITCQELVALLIDFVSDELPAESRARVEQHLLRCPPCVNYLDTYRITIRLTQKLPPQPLPPQLVERLRAALRDICQNKPEGERGPSAP